MRSVAAGARIPIFVPERERERVNPWWFPLAGRRRRCKMGLSQIHIRTVSYSMAYYTKGFNADSVELWCAHSLRAPKISTSSRRLEMAQIDSRKKNESGILRNSRKQYSATNPNKYPHLLRSWYLLSWYKTMTRPMYRQSQSAKAGDPTIARIVGKKIETTNAPPPGEACM